MLQITIGGFFRSLLNQDPSTNWAVFNCYSILRPLHTKAYHSLYCPSVPVGYWASVCTWSRRILLFYGCLLHSKAGLKKVFSIFEKLIFFLFPPPCDERTKDHCPENDYTPKDPCPWNPCFRQSGCRVSPGLHWLICRSH